LGRRLAEPGPAEGEILEREPKRLGVRELPLEEVEARLQRCELVVGEVEWRQEVALRAQRVELLARELVSLRVERDAERDQRGRGAAGAGTACLCASSRGSGRRPRRTHRPRSGPR